MRMLHSSGATGMASTIAIPEEHSLRGGNSMQGLKSDGTYSLRIHLESMFLFCTKFNTIAWISELEAKKAQEYFDKTQKVQQKQN